MSALLDTYASYVPHLIAAQPTSAPPGGPQQRTLDAALMFVDISGFTTLTERLAQQGPKGVEDLTRLINTTFSQILQTIEDYGGDVVKFAGDALLALWHDGQNLSETTTRAAACALDIQRRMVAFYRLVDSFRLTLRIGVAAGAVRMLTVGGVYGRWEVLLTGEPLAEVSAAEQLANPGEVLLTAAAWARIVDQCAGTPVSSGNHLFIRLADAPTTAGSQPPRQIAASVAALRAFIPGAVLSRLEAGQANWLAELRRVTVLFINLPELDHRVQAEQAHAVLRTLQESVYRFEGSVNKLSLDDKGVTLVAAFGLPPLAHEDDAARGALAALTIASALDALNCPGAIGVTTGRAFCGEIGSQQRREYTMLGGVVNLAARLMQAAAYHADHTTHILCDAATAQGARGRVAFLQLPALAVKGRAEPVAVLRPTEALAIRATDQSALQLVGRVRERAVLVGAVQELLRAATGGVVLIEGEAGMGKSRLLEELRTQAAQVRLTVLNGAAEPMEQASPYHAWRGVFSQLFDLSVLSAPDARRQHITNLIEDDEDLLELAPLLNVVLPLELPETPHTAPLTGQARAEATSDLLLRLLGDSAARSPKIVVLEDAHWFDSASWALTLAAARKLPRLLIVVALRPLSERRERHSSELPAAHEYDALCGMARTHLLLGALTPDEAVALAARRLGVDVLPEPVAELIRERGQGNPFFTEELAYVLRDTGQLLVTANGCELAPDANLDTMSAETITGAITSRIDRLTPRQQLTLKVASVIGRIFPTRTLHAVHPVASGSVVDADLATLAELDITPPEVYEEPAHSFKHAITQDVVYNLMLFAQRRQLHRAVAEWYERVYADDIGRLAQLLGYHWRQAGVVAKAVGYLLNAGREALRLGALREARAHLGQALELAQDGEDAASVQLQAIEAAQLLGETLHHLGEYAAARTRLAESLARARSSSHNTAVIDALLALGRLEGDIGAYAAARGYLTEAFAAADVSNDSARAARAQTFLSSAARQQGLFTEATERAADALARFTASGDDRGRAQVFSQLGNTALDQGAFARARACYEQSLALFDGVADQLGAAGVQNNLGWSNYMLGNYQEALANFERAYSLARQLGDQRATGATVNNIGFVHLTLGADAAARTCFDEALIIGRKIGAQPLVLEVLVGMADLLKRAGRVQDAAALIQFALNHPASNPDVATQVQLLRARAGDSLSDAVLEAALPRATVMTLEDSLALVQG